jgi:3-oxoacyl-[acyl-carrier protein] reductase
MDFHEQVVIVTGGCGGIGAAAVRMLAARGARAVAVDAHTDEAARLFAGCVGLSGEVTVERADVRDRVQVDRLVERALARWGRIDALINAAGAMEYAPVEAIDQATWLAALQVNLDSVFHTSKAVLRPMMRRRYGRIVTIAALHGVAGGPMQAAYSAATGAALGLTRALAREAAPWAITVNAVTPGLVATPMLAVIPPDQQAWGEQVIALRRVGQPEEVAAAALFLASPLASYITGVTLPVDGGWRMA